MSDEKITKPNRLKSLLYLLLIPASLVVDKILIEIAKRLDGITPELDPETEIVPLYTVMSVGLAFLITMLCIIFSVTWTVQSIKKKNRILQGMKKAEEQAKAAEAAGPGSTAK